MDTRGWYTVGYYNEEINDWYFNGEFETESQAIDVARRTALAKGTRARVTDQKTGMQLFFE